MLGNNMFAYCNNSPVMYSDPTGTELVLDKRIMFGAPGGGASAGLLDAIVSVCVAATAVIDTYRNRIKAKVDAKTEKTYQPNKHDHHIVPRTASKAAPARAILNEVYPEMGVEEPINKVFLDAKVHQFMHTNLYYGMVNYAMVTSYYAPAENKLQQKQNVDTALLLLRGLLLVIEKTV